MNQLITLLLVLCSLSLAAQTTIDFEKSPDQKLFIKLYGHIDYNQKIESGVDHAGKLDVHRLVTLFGYQFSRKTKFVTEIEIEHVKEVFVEQAFIKHRIGKQMDLKAGLLIVPMGLVNEQHEPTYFYTVERPLLDKNIVPSTWREIGLGISGLLTQHSLKYQLYLINSPISWADGKAKFNGVTGIRGGRQKGAESLITTFPGISGQLEYYGWADSKLGLSLYYGKSNTDLYGSLEEISVDSSAVTTGMIGLHATGNYGPFDIRAQYILSMFQNTEEYNEFGNTDLPQMMHGAYATIAYDFLKNDEQTLAPFIRYSHLNNHLKVNESMTAADGLKQDIFTIGINYKPHPGVVFKVDYQWYLKGDGNDYQQFNSGVGVWF